jgi:hypothetical protein
MNFHRSRTTLAVAASAVVGLIALVAPATQASAGSPTIAVTPTSGTSGANVSVSGSGWAAFDSLRVSLVQGSSTTFMCYLDATSSGTVQPQTCTVPTSIPQGAYTLTASDSTTSASTPFTLNPGITALGFDGAAATTVASGQTVGLTGNGFTASSPLTAAFNGTAVALTPPVTTTGVGQFSGTGLVVPAATAAGLYPLTVTDGAGHAATVHLRVYEATLTAAPAAAGISGATVSLSGSGWPNNDSDMRVELNVGTAQNFVCYASSDGNGNLASSCTLPTDLIQGKYNLVVEDNSLEVTIPYTLNPGITALGFDGADAITAASGQTVGLAGSGFAANSALKATFDSKTVALTVAATTTTDGQFSGTGIVIPTSTKTGVYAIKVTDAAGNAATIKLMVYKASLTAAPAATGISGAIVSVSGTGWPSNDSDMRVELNVGTAQNFVCYASSDGNGNLASSCTLPTDLIQGKYKLVVEDNSLAVSIGYTLNPGVTVLGFDGADAITAAAGQTVGLTGSGFSANAALKATFNGASVPFTAAASTNTEGQFSGTGIVIPAATAAGDYPITVKDSSGHIGTVKVSVFAATLTATPTTGISGQTFEVNGSGWPSNDSDMRVEINVGTTQNFACYASTDGNGNLAQSCTVPTGLIQGAYTLVVEDNSLAVSTPFTVEPGISLYASNGTALSSAAPGTAATVSGSGFAPNSTISKLTIGSTVVSFTTAPVTGATGSFTGGAFTVPAIAAGTYTVTVTDASGNQGTAQLTVT